MIAAVSGERVREGYVAARFSWMTQSGRSEGVTEESICLEVSDGEQGALGRSILDVSS